MGSHMKKAIFEEKTAKALKNWQRAAKERKKLRTKQENQNIGELQSSSSSMSGENTPSIGTTPIHLLHKYMHNSSDAQETGLNSPRSYYSETELSEGDVGPPTALSDNNDSVGHSNHNRNETHSSDFSFSQA